MRTLFFSVLLLTVSGCPRRSKPRSYVRSPREAGIQQQLHRRHSLQLITPPALLLPIIPHAEQFAQPPGNG